MYSYVPTVLDDSTWQDPIVQHAEGPLATKNYKIKIIVGNCQTTSFSLSIPDELPTKYEIQQEVTVDFGRFTQTPSCGYPIKTYSLQSEDGSALADIGVTVDNSGIMTISTVDDSLRDQRYPIVMKAVLDNDMKSETQLSFEITYAMSDIWNSENSCFGIIQNLVPIADQAYLSGSDMLAVQIPTSTEDCPYQRQVQVKVDYGEFDTNQIQIGDDRITIETPFSVPSAQIGVNIDIELFAETDDFDIARQFSFKIALYGQDVEDIPSNSTDSSNSTASDSNSDSSTQTSSIGSAYETGPRVSNSADQDNYEFSWDYASQTQAIEADNIEPLEVKFYSISPTGVLLIKFNKPFIEPPIRIETAKDGAERRLQNSRRYDIGEVLEFSLASTEMSDEEIEQFYIKEFELMEIEE